MNWGDHGVVRDKLRKRWKDGRLLAGQIDPETSIFPLRIPLKHPTARELTDHFDDARKWIAALQQAADRHDYTLEWKSFRHRLRGANRLPVAAIVESPEVALSILCKQAEAHRFETLAGQTRESFPELLDWLARKPLKALEHAGDWPRLLSILGWVRDHPHPGCYLRQIDLPGVHTKFIETHRGLLSELLDIVLPDSAIEHSVTGVRQFERRYGFRAKPALIRFRLLDRRQHIGGLRDLTIPLEDFRRLDPPARRIFITENDINGLAFPELPDSLVIFGLGYGLDALKDIPWLSGREMHYWGDIDTHGFAMLNRLRGYHPHVRSLLMDEDTLLRHRALWGHEKRPIQRQLPHLTDTEEACYTALRDNRFQENLRLEQEHIGFHWLEARLETLDPTGN